MIVSYNWLKELINLNVSPEKLVEEMSLYSVEVETFNKMVKATNLVVGYVLECVDHPDSDHLHVCKVDLGEKVDQIVCGAPNIAAGQKVIVALPGAVLPGGTIKNSKVRGVESNGMICSLQELGIENKYVPAIYQNGIYVLDSDATPGQDALEYLCFDDYLIELSLTPNRMDLMSMLGVAHDVSAMYNVPMNELEYKFTEADKLASDEISVKLETEDCYSYYARIVKDVVIKESPKFIKARLIASGVRPINNVVDITNYVLMLFGQPLHSFDQDKLGDTIIVRNALDGEVLETLDDLERKLVSSDIVISDNLENNRAVCVAGVMGGKSTEVTLDTKNIVLESAVFKPLSVRKTSARLGLRSESSVRFERGVDLNRSLAAVDYACYLLEKYADGKVLKGYVHEGIKHLDDKEIHLTEKYVEEYLGINIPTSLIKEILEKLCFSVEVNGSDIKVMVPNRRLDIEIKQDLIEEIARMYGYDKLNETLPSMTVEGELTHAQKIRKVINKTLVGLGLSETVSYSLVSPKLADMCKVLFGENLEPIKLLHPMTDEHSILRRSIVPSLIDVVKYNNARKNYNLALYEIAMQYGLKDKEPTETYLLAGALQGVHSSSDWQGKKEVVDFYYVKGILNVMFERVGAKVKYAPLSIDCPELHPGRSAEIILNNEVIGYLGELHPTLVKQEDIEPTYVFEIKLQPLFDIASSVVLFKQISKVPSVERDLALVMDQNILVGEVIDAIYRCDKNMIKNVSVFDIYVGDKIESGKKSVAVRITLESLDTLTDEVINQKMKKILNTLAYMYKIEIRK